MNIIKQKIPSVEELRSKQLRKALLNSNIAITELYEETISQSNITTDTEVLIAALFEKINELENKLTNK